MTHYLAFSKLINRNQTGKTVTSQESASAAAPELKVGWISDLQDPYRKP